MSSKRDKFYTLCRKLWTAGTFVFAASAIFIAGSNHVPEANAQWNGDTHIFTNTTIVDEKEADSLVVDANLTISGTGSVTTTKNTTIGSTGAGSIEVQNGGSLKVGAGDYPKPEDLPNMAGGSSLTVNNGGTLVLDEGGSFDDAARVLLNGNVSLTGSGSDNKIVLGNYALINATGKDAAYNLGYYVIADVANSGNGSVTITNSGVEMGDYSAILAGKGGMIISGSRLTGTKQGMTTAGHQTFETAGDMSITDSQFVFGNSVRFTSEGEMNFKGSSLEAISYYLVGKGDVTLENSRVGLNISDQLTGNEGSIVSMTGDVVIKNSSVGQGVYGNITSRSQMIVIEDGSSIIQESNGGINGATGLTINASNVTQESRGTLSVVGTSTGLATLDITNGATIKQEYKGTISIGSGGFAGGSINITGAETVIHQGSEGNISAFGVTSSGTGGNITVNAATINQGTNSNMTAGAAIDLTDATIKQGVNGNIETTTGPITLDGSKITQGDDSWFHSGSTLELFSSEINQGDNSEISAEGNFSLDATSKIVQDDHSSIISNATLTTAVGSEITQGDNASLIGNSLVLNGTVVQEDESSINAEGTLTLGGSGNIFQGDGAEIRGNALTLNGTIVQDEASLIIGTTLTLGAGGSITQGAGATLFADNMTLNGTVVQGNNAELFATSSWDITGKITQGDSSDIYSLNVLSMSSGDVVQGDQSEIYGANGVHISGGTLLQGNQSHIATAAGKNITLGGTIGQGSSSRVETSNGGVLAFNSGATLVQGAGSYIVNNDIGTLNLSNVQISQGTGSQFTTGGDLYITNGSYVTQDTKSRITINNGKLVVDNSGLYTQADGAIQTEYLGDIAMTEEEKRLSDTSIEVLNTGRLELGAGTQITSLGDPAAFHKIEISANSEIFSHGLLTFNNDWINLQEDALLASTTPTGMIQLINNSRLYGTGTIKTQGGLIISSGSVLAPGNNFGDDNTVDQYGQMGVITIEGPLVITGGGILEITTNGANCDYLLVKDYVSSTGEVSKGDVLLGGELIMKEVTESELEHNVYTIIRSEGKITGELEFAKFWDVEQWTDTEGGYNTYNVSLIRNNYFDVVGNTFNQKAGGRMLNEVPLTADWLQHLIAIEDQIDNRGNYAVLDMIAGVTKANGLYLYRETPWRTAMDQYGWNMCGQAYLGYQSRYCPNTCLQSEVWATPYHTESRYKSDGNAMKYDSRTTGFMAGINYRVSPRTVFGVVFGYGRPELEQGRDEIEMDDFLIGLQAGTMLTSKLELKTMVAGGFQQYSMKRFLNGTWLGNEPSRFANSDYDGNTLFASIELARPIYFNNRTMLRPVIAFESENSWQEGFSETGGGAFDLTYSKASYNQAYFRIGASGEADMGMLSLTGHAFYSCNVLGDTYSDSSVKFKNVIGAGPQTIRGIDLDRHFLNVGAGANMYLSPMKTSSVSARYDATISDKATSHAMLLGFSKLF